MTHSNTHHPQDLAYTKIHIEQTMTKNIALHQTVSNLPLQTQQIQSLQVNILQVKT